MSEKVYIFGHKNPDTDSICSSLVEEILDKKNGWKDVEAKRLGKINKETQYVLDYLGIEPPELLEKVEENQDVLLVDHNDFAESVEGIEKAKILGVTDHHKIGNFRTVEPLYYTAKPYGCTCTIFYEEFKRLGHKIEKKEAVLMLSAIISDTLLLKSPTTTEHDRVALEELSKIANIDVNTYGLEMLKAGTDLSDFSEKELINLDAKLKITDNFKYIVAQVNAVSIDDVLKRKEKLEEEILKSIKENELDMFVLLITDILNSNSEAIVLGNRSDVAEKAFGKNLENNRMFLEGVVSRKKQVVPVIEKNI